MLGGLLMGIRVGVGPHVFSSMQALKEGNWMVSKDSVLCDHNLRLLCWPRSRVLRKRFSGENGKQRKGKGGATSLRT